jgi:hypothetical protein
VKLSEDPVIGEAIVDRLIHQLRKSLWKKEIVSRKTHRKSRFET